MWEARVNFFCLFLVSSVVRVRCGRYFPGVSQVNEMLNKSMVTKIGGVEEKKLSDPNNGTRTSTLICSCENVTAGYLYPMWVTGLLTALLSLSLFLYNMW